MCKTMKTLRTLPVFASLLIVTAVGSQDIHSEKQTPIVSEACIDPPYKVHLFSSSPLVIYIEDFLLPSEREYLLEITKDTFSSSTVADASGAEGLRSTRSSHSTSVPRDATTRCIEARALSIQGFDTTPRQLEPMQLVRYEPGGSYHWHTDWFTSPSQAGSSAGGNRLSSFFVYVLAANVTGGGTNFPMLEPPVDEKWCAFVDCDEEYEKGVTFRPREGGAVFWRNLVQEGKGWRGDERTLHAGLPVERGVKVGMNIWTREAEMEKEFRGLD